MKDKCYRYIYKIICLCGDLKDKYYIGQHTTYNLNDGYLGSSSVLPKYWKKYGKIENVTYRKEILSFNEAKCQAALDILEKIYIGDLYKTDKMCLNRIRGGCFKKRNRKSHTFKPKEEKSQISYTQEIRNKYINELQELDILYKLNKKDYDKKYNQLLISLIKYGTTPSLLRQSYYGNL